MTTFKQLRMEPDTYYFVSPCGLGDTLILCGLHPQLQEKFGKIHFIIKQSHEFILQQYNIAEYTVVVFDNEECLNIGEAQEKPEKGKLFIAHMLFNAKSQKMLVALQKQHVPFLQYYTNFFGIDDGAQLQKPAKQPSMSKKIHDQLRSIGPLNRIVLLAPLAESVPPLPRGFWFFLTIILLVRGNKIICNRAPLRLSAWGLVQTVDPSIEDLVALGLRCHKVYALRSGFCDLLVASGGSPSIYYANQVEKYASINSLFKRTDIHEVFFDAPNDTVVKAFLIIRNALRPFYHIAKELKLRLRAIKTT